MIANGRVVGSLLVLAGIGGFGLGWDAVASGRIRAPSVDVTWRPFESDGYIPSRGVSRGRELALVFVGSPSCVWSSSASLRDAISVAKLRLAFYADSIGWSFAAMAAVNANSTETGARYAGRFGAFDELAVGRGWTNIALLRYVYETFPGPPATPQVVIVTRTVDVEPRRRIRGERVLLRRVGAKAIADWVAQGAPLPTVADDG